MRDRWDARFGAPPPSLLVDFAISNYRAMHSSVDLCICREQPINRTIDRSTHRYMFDPSIILPVCLALFRSIRLSTHRSISRFVYSQHLTPHEHRTCFTHHVSCFASCQRHLSMLMLVPQSCRSASAVGLECIIACRVRRERLESGSRLVGAASSAAAAHAQEDESSELSSSLIITIEAGPWDGWACASVGGRRKMCATHVCLTLPAFPIRQKCFHNGERSLQAAKGRHRA